MLTTLNLLALACHTAADLVDDLWRTARLKAHTCVGFFNNLNALTVFAVFPSWEQLLEVFAFQRPMPQPP